MPDDKSKDVDHAKREQARRDLSTEFERLQQKLLPVRDAYDKVKKAEWDDDLAQLLKTLDSALHRAIDGGFFGEGVGPFVRAREKWLAAKGK
jgi:hypothetical protein